MEYVGSALDELAITEQGSRRGRMNRRSTYKNDETTEFKSKNLHAERRRRQKLSDRLLALRALVPIITNMNKATIIEDAISYITDLQTNVEVLQNLLYEMEASSEEGAKPSNVEIDTAEEMANCGIQEEVEVTHIGGNKLWVKVVLEKKKGGFTRLVEKMSEVGFEFTHTSVTTCKGAIVVSSHVEGIYGRELAVQHTRELLLQIINGI